MMNKHCSDLSCDVLINGAGLVGSICALSLAQNGLDVLILDQRSSDPPTEPEPIRVSALNIASQNILTALGVWNRLSREVKTPFENIEVWDASGNGHLKFEAASVGLEHLGHIVSNSGICATLHQVINEHPNTSIIWSDAITGCATSEDKITVVTENSRTINSQLLVGSDGAKSNTRRLANIDHEAASYQQLAIIASVTTSKPHDSCARQRFLETGPLAFLPISNHQCSIVWSADLEEANRLLTLSDAAFSEALAAAFNYELGSIASVSLRKSFPLARQHAKRYIGDRIALIGDAAHTVHPLAGLGANQGISDAAALSQIINARHSDNRDFSTRSVLRRYERWRRSENAFLIDTIDSLQKCFGIKNPVVSQARTAGLNLTARSEILKRKLVHHAIGFGGQTPRLAQQ